MNYRMFIKIALWLDVKMNIANRSDLFYWTIIDLIYSSDMYCKSNTKNIDLEVVALILSI